MNTRAFALRSLPRRPEHRHTFPCFGGECTVLVADAARPADAAAAAAMAQRALLTWHRRFSRFTDDSELTRLNRDPSLTVAVSPLMRRLVQTGVTAGRDTGGLVDITLADEIERAGYAAHMERPGTALEMALAPPRAPASPHPDERWRAIQIDARHGTVTRPPGLRLDFGGIAKGVFADELAGMLAGFDAYVIDCAGDLRIGGGAGLARPVRIAGPGPRAGALHTFGVAAGAVATSGISHRSWTVNGRPAHHLLDPCTGAPVFTGVVQATALAPTAGQAEVLAKAAILSGPQRAAEWLTHGGLIVRDDGSYELLEPAGSRSAAAAVRSASQPSMSSSTASRSGSLKISWKRPS